MSFPRPGPANAALYAAGGEYARVRARLDRSAASPADTLDAVGRIAGTSRAEVRTAIEFFESVDAIARAAGREARGLILGGRNPHLAPDVVRRLARRSGESLTAALERAARSMHPFARPLPAGTPRHLARWDHDLDRLTRAGRLLGAATAALARGRPGESARSDLFRNATAVRVAAAALRLAIGVRPSRTDPGPPDAGNGTPAAADSPAAASAPLVKARRLVERVTRDLPLGVMVAPPRGPAKVALAAAVARVRAAADRLAAAAAPRARQRGGPPPRVVDRACPPGPDGGTYVVVLRLAAPEVVRVGRLGTFWLPAGFLLYVGSAFQPGGVAARSGRHRRPDAPLRWNLDHLKAVARPVEIWWTHNRRDEPVECPWAMALAILPGMSCPAPRCGANDCKRCPAHLFHSTGRPSCDDFLAQAAGHVPRASPVFRWRSG